MKLGPYEIQSPLGAGGMGEVYRARDTRLDRTVAIKILASHLSSSPELKLRMEREARAISSLNHPHICQLYDIGAQDGVDFLVMEFLEGETLADRLRKGPLPLAEVYRIGIAVAEALAVAHRQGIVHRDLKPGNIMLTQAGAKLMDFGLAKPLAGQSSGSGSGSGSGQASASAPPSFTAAATMSGASPLTPLTMAGSIVGTIQYMSPEQIEGKEADARSDIFAFGGVLYEMVAGKRPFAGKSQISLASSILETDPEKISVLKPQVSPALEHVVTTCLQKNPDDRFLAAHDIKLELRWIAAGGSAGAPVVPAETARATSRHRVLWIAGIAAAIVIGTMAGYFLARPAANLQVVRTVIDPPEKSIVSLTGDFAGPPVLSPDGATVAFVATNAEGKPVVWVRPMSGLDARAVPGTQTATFPFWSPDGKSLGFFADNQMKIVDLNGSAPVTVAEAPFGRGGAWAADGTIVFSPSTLAGLMKVNVSGSAKAVTLTNLDTTTFSSHRWPFALPDGKHYIYSAINHDSGKSSNNAIFYASVEGGEGRLLLHCSSNAVYGSGYLLFARGDQLFAQAFDPASGKLSGEPQGIANGVVNDISTWHMDVSADNNGLMVYGSGGSADWNLVWVDRSGKQTGVVADKLTNLQAPKVSPQGDRIAFETDTGVGNITVLDLARATRTKITFGPTPDGNPIWSPDGKWIAYSTDRTSDSSIYRKLSDGSGAEETLLTQNDDVVTPSDWSRDGKYLLYTKGTLGNKSSIWVLPLEGDRKPQKIVDGGNTTTGQGVLSPDGRWLAYVSGESGAPEVFVIPFRGGQGKWQVSTGAGLQPCWSHDGKELYFINNLNLALYAVPVKEAGEALEFGPPQEVAVNQSIQNVSYDVAPDGKILMQVATQQVNQSMTVVANFTAGLKK